MAFKSVFNVFGNNNEFPSDYINHYDQGVKLAKGGKFRNAIKFYDRAIELNPYVPEVYVEKGIALFNISSFNESLESFERALKLKGSIKEAFLYKGRILLQRSKFKDALLCFNNYLKLDSNSSDAFLYKGIALIELGEFDVAYESLEESLKLDPTNSKAFIKKASILIAKGNFKEAMSYIDKALEDEKNNSELFSEKGICLYQMKNFEDCLEYLDMALKIDPNCSKALYYKGLVFLNELYKYGEAITCFDKYSSLQEDDYKGYLQKSITFIELRKYQESLAASKEAIRINDQIPELFYQQGLVYLLLSKWDESLVSLNKALVLNPNYKDALEKKEYVLKMQSRINIPPERPSHSEKSHEKPAEIKILKEEKPANISYEKPLKKSVIEKETIEEKKDKVLDTVPISVSKEINSESKTSKNNKSNTPTSMQNASSELTSNDKKDISSKISKPLLEKETGSISKIPVKEPLRNVQKQSYVQNNETNNSKPKDDSKILKQKSSVDNNLDEDLKLFKYILEKDSIPISKIDIKDLLDGQDIIYSIEENPSEPDDMDMDMDSDIETFNFEDLANFGANLEFNGLENESNNSTDESTNEVMEENKPSFDIDNFIISKATFLDDTNPVAAEENTINNDIEPISYEDDDLSSFIIDSKSSIGNNDSFIISPNSNEDNSIKELPIEEIAKTQDTDSVKPQINSEEPIENPIDNPIVEPEEKVIFTKFTEFNADFKDEDLIKYDKLIDEVHFMPFEEGQNKLWKDILNLDSWFVFENIYKFQGPFYENINGKLWLLTFTDTAHLSKCLKEIYLNPDIVNVLSIKKLDDSLINELKEMGIYGLWFNKGQHCWFITLEDLKKLR